MDDFEKYRKYQVLTGWLWRSLLISKHRPQRITSQSHTFYALYLRFAEEHTPIFGEYLCNTLYGCTFKNQNKQSLAADLSPGLTLITKWEKNWLVTFITTETKFITFYHHNADPELSSAVIIWCSLKEASLPWTPTRT